MTYEGMRIQRLRKIRVAPAPATAQSFYRYYGQFTTVKVTVWTCPDGGLAESWALSWPVNVPVVLVVPLKVPVLVSKLIEIHASEEKPKLIGGNPPEVCAVNEYGRFAHALGSVAELVITRGSAMIIVYWARAISGGFPESVARMVKA